MIIKRYRKNDRLSIFITHHAISDVENFVTLTTVDGIFHSISNMYRLQLWFMPYQSQRFQRFESMLTTSLFHLLSNSFNRPANV